MAIGLQEVDNLKPSKYLEKLLKEGIEGTLTIEEVEKALKEYYIEKENKNEINHNELECDFVSARIVELLNKDNFNLSVDYLKYVHKFLFQDVYEFAGEFRNKAKQERTDVTEDVVFEMELIKSIEVDIDYILGLVKKYHDSNMEDKEILITIQKTIMASPDLRNKKDLIMAFIESLDQDSNVYADFESFMDSKKKEELDKIIAEENLNKEETYSFIQKSFEQGRVETNGTEVSSILPPMNMFTPTNDRQEKKNNVIDKLLNFFNKYFNISSSKF